MKIKKFVFNNWLLIVIILLASAIRLWDISGRAIFFDDAAFDMWSGMQALEKKELPLLGIASSLPRFHQGPVTVWLEMILGAMFGFNLLPFLIFFVSLSLAALVLVYFFCERFLGKRIALVVIFLMALSPFAIAQARMPYHTNPIPLAVILYLLALMGLWQEKKGGLFWAVLSWAFLFQFELAIFPALILIPYVLLRTKNWSDLPKKAMTVLGALLIGLLPQIIFDLKNNFAQLGLFVVWVGYRIVGIFGGEHRMSAGKLQTVASAFARYGERIWTVDSAWVGLIFLLLIVFAFVKVFLSWQKKRPIKPGLELVSVSTLILVAGYLVHGAPSEAYFPPFIILLPILVAFGLTEIFKKKTLILVGLLMIWGASNIWGVFKSNFFVSNLSAFGYHYSVTEQRAIVDFINQQSKGDFVFQTTGENQKFASTFDSLRWLAMEKDIREHRDSQNIFYIEIKNSVLQNDPKFKVRNFKSVDVYYEK